MLNELHIENIAVIERADIRFEPGLNILTGETGAEAASAVLEQRRAAWPLKPPPARKGILKRYTQFAESAMKGAGY